MITACRPTPHNNSQLSLSPGRRSFIMQASSYKRLYETELDSDSSKLGSGYIPPGSKSQNDHVSDPPVRRRQALVVQMAVCQKWVRATLCCSETCRRRDFRVRTCHLTVYATCNFPRVDITSGCAESASVTPVTSRTSAHSCKIRVPPGSRFRRDSHGTTLIPVRSSIVSH